MAKKIQLTLNELKNLMRLSYEEGNNYAYYCMLFSHEKQDSAKDLAIEKILRNKKITTQRL